MYFYRDLAVIATTMAAAKAAYPTADIEHGCYKNATVSYTYSEVQSWMYVHQSAIDYARSEIDSRVDCETEKLARLQQLTNVQNADPYDYLLTQAQKDIMKEAHLSLSLGAALAKGIDRQGCCMFSS